MNVLRVLSAAVVAVCAGVSAAAAAPLAARLSRGETRLEMLTASMAFVEKHNPPN
ncbi:hypothetical protein [Phenylobacterium sp.]|uniref:hypothetical protein n=1 Tax=Phenylobacterium sp. TaxID=1871053 RepID=UPI0025DE2E75|nr:hypothetical protein [Phenylobacterium sp.]MBX3485370.1 hypothetical protein [Phenylobacterium sp.]MCW5759693.1 hypothetical protein [Phenylobacterium sp.]